MLAGGCDDVHCTVGMANQFAGQGGVVDLGDLTVAWGADDDHAGVVCIGEVRYAPAGAAVPADHPKQVAGAGNPSRVDALDVVSDDVAGCVGRFEVEGQFLTMSVSRTWRTSTGRSSR